LKIDWRKDCLGVWRPKKLAGKKLLLKKRLPEKDAARFLAPDYHVVNQKPTK